MDVPEAETLHGKVQLRQKEHRLRPQPSDKEDGDFSVQALGFGGNVGLPR